MKLRQTLLGMTLAAALVLPASAAEALTVNGENLWDQAGARLVEDTTYVSLRAVSQALVPGAQVAWEDGAAQVWTEDVTLTARPGDQWLRVNGRAMYIPEIGRAHV